jgi:hypothetical protein
VSERFAGLTRQVKLQARFYMVVLVFFSWVNRSTADIAQSVSADVFVSGKCILFFELALRESLGHRGYEFIENVSFNGQAEGDCARHDQKINACRLTVQR